MIYLRIALLEDMKELDVNHLRQNHFDRLHCTLCVLIQSQIFICIRIPDQLVNKIMYAPPAVLAYALLCLAKRTHATHSCAHVGAMPLVLSSNRVLNNHAFF